MPAKAPVQQYRMPSGQSPVFWPLINAPGLPPTGVQVGIDELSGAVFHCDPLGWVLDPNIAVTNPNVMVFGKPGLGKSATVKAIVNRFLGFGYRAMILGDPKDEYEAICRAWGVEPFAIGHGLPARVNPLALGPLGQGWDNLTATEAQTRAQIIFSRWLTLVRGLVGSMKIGELNVPYGPTEAEVVKVALEELTGYSAGATALKETTVPQLWRLLDEPPAEIVRRCRYESRQAFIDDTRLLRNALGQLVSGPLAGLFDDHTTIDIDWTAPIQSLSLSRLEPLGDEAVGIALLCVNSWGQGMREASIDNAPFIDVRDEAWRQFRLGVEAVKAFDAALRLSRGVAGRGGGIQIAVAHKPSDLLTFGDQGSQATAIAQDLLALADIKINHGQDGKVAKDVVTSQGLSGIAEGRISGWARQKKGRAFWVVGDGEYLAETVLHPLERDLYYTNSSIESAA